MKKAGIFLLGMLLLAIACGQPEPAPEKPSQIPVRGISVSPLQLTLEPGSSERIVLTVVPEDADDPSVRWSSADKTVVTVAEDGLVTAVGPGTAGVTAVSNDGGFRATCFVTVPGPEPEPEPKPEPEPEPDPRWADTGADVPVYPTYRSVGSLADFPAIYITTDDGKRVESKTEYKTGTIRVVDPAGMYSDVKEVPAAPMRIRGRGNTTWDEYKWIKPPYRIKLDKKSKYFGMKSDKDWILLCDHGDPSLMRTAVAMWISRLVSMPWTPEFRLAEVYFNGSYQGAYYLVEQKEVDRENKIPITPMEGDQTEGGFLVELDGKDDDDLFFKSRYFNKKIKYKDPDEPTSAQQLFIQDCLNRIEKKLQEKAFTGEESYRTLIEMDSWIQNYLVQEISMNIDGNMRLSTYFAKDADTRVFMPMVWDFDRAFGNVDYMRLEFNVPMEWPEGWFVRLRGGEPGYDGSYWYGYRPTWYQFMFEDPVFVERLKQLWALYKPRLERIPAFIDQMQAYHALACAHNQAFFHTADQAAAVARLRREYIQRIDWLDRNLPALQARTYDPVSGQYR